MLAMFSVADASIIVAVVTATATFVTVRRSRKVMNEINLAVNHQGKGSPTLVQRVIRMEKATAAAALWELSTLSAMARQLGIEIPQPPQHISDIAKEHGLAPTWDGIERRKQRE